MKRVMFFDDKINPKIYIKFVNNDNVWYQYTGFELGEFEIYKNLYFNKKVGELISLLKSKSYITTKKVELGI